jgi:uncharacterized paraquat-inducible protein A
MMPDDVERDDDLDADSAQLPDDLVVVATYESAPTAELARMHLAEAGINSQLADEETVAMTWGIAAAVGYIKLLVARADATMAQDLLAKHVPPPVGAEAEDEDARIEAASSTCLSCGEPLAESQSRCLKCGWSYEGEEGSFTPSPP